MSFGQLSGTALEFGLNINFHGKKDIYKERGNA